MSIAYFLSCVRRSSLLPYELCYKIFLSKNLITLQIFCIAVQIIAAILILMVKHGEANGAEAVATGKQ